MDRIRDSEFYEGFEGEGEIDLIYKKEGKEIKRLEIWYGYFSTLLILFFNISRELMFKSNPQYSHLQL